MTGARDGEALRKTTSLMDYLAEVTDAAERDPVRDILADQAGAPDPVIWLEELPEGVRVTTNASDDVILRVRPPKSAPEPRPPATIVPWIDSEKRRGPGGLEPELIERGPVGADPDELSEPPNSVVREFNGWLSSWRIWSREQMRMAGRRRLYERLEEAAKRLEQQDDEYELVLAVGLVQWSTPDGERICRHLVSEPVIAKLDRATADVVVSLVGGKRRFEDKELFADLEEYQADRGRVARQAVLECEGGSFSADVLKCVQDWLGLGLGVPFDVNTGRIPASDGLPLSPALSQSPALLLRPRSRVMLAEAYRRIAEALKEPNAQVPIALAQLVMDTEAPQRNVWLHEQGAASGDVLGADPLFPLPTNGEQRRVIELLRTEIGVVVQGPPGTGKTHTIANLVSALLARGQRVLVTSQKDQALKVLREKIPAELRRLCVLLAGGSKDAAKELEQGLHALSGAIASPDTRALPQRIAMLTGQRHDLRSRSAGLNNRIRQLREVEDLQHDAVVPGFSTTQYTGTLTEIVREVKRNASAYDWMPTVDPSWHDLPPLSTPDMLDLLTLLRTDTPIRRARAGQEIPASDALPKPGELTAIFAAERQAQETAHVDTSEITTRLATAGLDRLQDLRNLRDQIRMLLSKLGFGEDGRSTPAQQWVAQAVADRLARRHAGLWGHLAEVNGEASRLQQRLQAQGVSVVVEIDSGRQLGIGEQRGLLKAGRQLHAYLEQGKKLHRGIRKSSIQKEAALLLEVVRVDGQRPNTPEQLRAALDHIEAQVAAAQLVQKWADVHVTVSNDRLTRTLSELEDNERMLNEVQQLAILHDRVDQHLRHTRLLFDVSTVSSLVALLDAVPGALNYVELERARTQVDKLYKWIQALTTASGACPELRHLLEAIGARDSDAYSRGLEAIEVARAEYTAEQRRARLVRTLRAVHPLLYDSVERTFTDPAWDVRLNDLPAAWAWSKAEQFVQRWRNADEERRLVADFDQVEARIKQVTEQLAAAAAMQACVERMSDAHAQALRSYREHMSHVGAGTGSKVREYRKAARAAMEKAKDAVPAWVVPLPNLLDNIAPNRDSFDVVIVDEASQVGLEHLFLLWMAPRVIVVGDDKQCTPGANRMSKLDELFASMREHLGEIDEETRLHFTSKSNLYGVLSARSGRDAVVRLREHFRCMPEIINWSSRQFYGDGDTGLIALRERTAEDLEPLKVVHVTDAYTEGRDTKRRNPVEAKRIVSELTRCLADPRYNGKSFGIVVLQGQGQINLLEHEINATISPEEREARGIRVGSPPNFQGDERDVIFLSTVVADVPRMQTAPNWQQAYNVAASRAKDQMWLFTSVRPADFKTGDLRGSLANYMLNPPSVFGKSPDLDAVSPDEHCEPFESLFEQRVFREIKKRGHHVIPQFRVGSRTLDLVIVGDGGRLAVECDGHHWHTSVTQQVSDARRDRELRRMRWDVIRVRESEFEFDPERELAPLWQRLEKRGIHPHSEENLGHGEWSPVELAEESDELQGAEL